MKYHLLLSNLLPAVSALAAHQGNSHCRCRPHEPCWPSQDQWKALNQSVDGNLIAVKPVAYQCHDPDYNKATCNATTEAWGDSVWRTSQPGAVQWTNWEAWSEHNQTCYIDTPRSLPCGQGRISLYSVMAEKPEHIQAAVRFVAKHDVRLAIKNSGHCFLGRSTAPESLQIATTKMKSIKFVDDFKLTGAKGCAGPSRGAAVTIGAGVQLAELYKAAAGISKSVIVGLSHTVGAAGGYIQGGGHSPLGPWKGMGSDNALEFTVVNAKGEHVVANDVQNQDLFWALRGGGGGTFGVVTSVTIRTYPDVPGYFSQIGVNVPKSEQDAYWKAVEKFHQVLPALSDAGGAGYYGVIPQTSVNDTDMSTFSLTLFLVNVTDPAPARKAMDELMTELVKAAPDAKYELMPVPAVFQAMAFQLNQGSQSDGTGGIATLGSRLFSRELLTKSHGPSDLTKALRDVHNEENTVGYTGHIVAGGAVASNKVDSAVNPAWRKALTHIVFAQDWASNATLEEQQKVQNKITNVLVARLRQVEPHMGAYLNEADAHEKDFQQSFWGHNYRKLYSIKQKVDPQNIFIARRGVASEDWDDAGLCRIKK